jgi:GNAT superfamily N-acetyltransferase
MRLPNFLIIGANRAGTTALAAYLGQHPQIFISPVKEPTFFVFDGNKALIDKVKKAANWWGGDMVVTLEEYAHLFDGAVHEVALGEASTAYLHNPVAARRIQQYVPDMKIVAVLRHPAERAFSNYLMYRRERLEKLRTFRRAIRKEKQRINSGYSQGYHYVQLGYYYRTLHYYYETFPSHQIRVYLYEDWTDEPIATIRDICRFLEVDDSFTPDMSRRHNASLLTRSDYLDTLVAELRRKDGVWRRLLPESARTELADRIHRWNHYKPHLPAKDRRRLIALYRDDILQLQDLIQRDLTHWLT